MKKRVNEKEVNIFNLTPKFKFPHQSAINLAYKVITHFHFKIECINIIFMNNKDIRKVNKEFLSHDFPTDVISFRLNTGKSVDGELYIGVDVAKENASIYGENFYSEIKRLIIHGTLHLVGFVDTKENDRAKMREWENHFLICDRKLK